MSKAAQEWPPNYADEYVQRGERFTNILSSGNQEAARLHLSTSPLDFIRHWCFTYDPRNAGSGIPAWMPFIPFERQKDLVCFIEELLKDQECGLIEKSRDMGATWLCCAISVWLWLFVDGSAVGWGSRKEMLVDRIGDPDSIFEKIRMIILNLPGFLLPVGFSEAEHLNHMKCINPANGATITGEAGENIGRGGRKLIYFKDESAHYERADKIEASLGDNTSVQIDISSVNGEGNVFHRKRHGGGVRVFEMDWRDHPAKTQEWYDKRRDKAEREGLLHLFAQEVDRDYSAAVEGIFIPSEYVKACVDAHEKINIEPVGQKISGLDVADEGGDKNAQINVWGPFILDIEQWGEGDTVKTAKRAWNYAIDRGMDELIYDSIGVGAGVKGKTNELKEMAEERGEEVTLKVTGFNAGAGVAYPKRLYVDGKKNQDMFANLKAQGWWHLRDRCYKTYLAVTTGEVFPPEELMTIPSDLEYCHQLVSELSRPKRETDDVGRVKVESKKKMKARGIPSPNLADALVQCYAPKQGARKVRVKVVV